LATFGDDSKLKLWSLSSGACLHTWPAKADVISHSYFPLTFSPDGKVLALGGRGPNLFFWDAQTGKELKVVSLGGSYGFVERLAFSPDGQLLALHSTNGPKILEVAPLLGSGK
jgi:WD40 repeat protein